MTDRQGDTSGPGSRAQHEASSESSPFGVDPYRADPLTYGSVCSGIEAATVAWHPLGWHPAFFSEIEAFPRAVLAHHYPDVPCHGDFTTIERGQYEPIDTLVGGTPCQSFSVAGLRGGLADDRGNLALEFLRLAQRLGPRWLVWENVPGVLSSNGGRDFGAILGGMVELGYGFAYRVLDAQHCGVPQRRRRVFVVGYLGDWRPPAAVLFERHSLSGNPPPRREAREDAAHSLRARANASHREDSDNYVAYALNAHGGSHGRQDAESETLIAAILDANYGKLQGASNQDANHGHSHLVPVPFDTTQITSAANYSNPQPGDPCHPLAAGAHVPAIAFSTQQTPKGWDIELGTCPTLQVPSRSGGGQPHAVAFTQNQCGDLLTGDVMQSLSTNSNATGRNSAKVHLGMAVRRLTPRECERLQGFPDDYTDVPYRGKPAADGPRYKALGNSMAVPCMRWIGERIQMTRAILAQAGETRRAETTGSVHEHAVRQDAPEGELR